MPSTTTFPTRNAGVTIASAHINALQTAVNVLEARGGGVEISVASFDASTAVKDRAHFVCTSLNDSVTAINSAIAALPAYGGTIKFSGGRFFFRSVVAPTKPVHFLGSGAALDSTRAGTSFSPASTLADGLLPVGGVPRGLIEIGQTATYTPACVVQDIGFDGRNIGVNGINTNQLVGMKFSSYKGKVIGCHFTQFNGDGARIGAITTGNDSVDSYLIGNQFWQNRGRGLVITATGGPQATDMHVLFNVSHSNGHDLDAALAALDGGHGLYFASGSAGLHLFGGQSYDNIGAGVYNASTLNEYVGIKIENNDHGFYAASGSFDLTGCIFRGNSAAVDNVSDNIHIASGVDNFTILGGRNGATTNPSGNVARNQVRAGIYFAGTPGSVGTISNHRFFIDGTGGLAAWGSGGKIANLPSAIEVIGCPNFVTSAHGTQALTAGAGSAAITHGLDVTPALADIILGMQGDIGSGARLWKSNPTATQYTLNWAGVTGTPTADWAFTRRRG